MPEGESEKEGTEGEEVGRDGIVEVMKRNHYPSSPYFAPFVFSRGGCTCLGPMGVKCLGPMILVLKTEANTPQRGPDSNVMEAFLSRMSQTRERRHETSERGVAITVARATAQSQTVQDSREMCPSFTLQKHHGGSLGGSMVDEMMRRKATSVLGNRCDGFSYAIYFQHCERSYKDTLSDRFISFFTLLLFFLGDLRKSTRMKY
jgi:hypothetical protein